MVPKTRVVRLAADSFNYPAYERHLITAKREINESVGRRVFQPKGLHPKVKINIDFNKIFLKKNIYLRLVRFNYLLKIMLVLMYFLNN